MDGRGEDQLGNLVIGQLTIGAVLIVGMVLLYVLS